MIWSLLHSIIVPCVPEKGLINKSIEFQKRDKKESGPNKLPKLGLNMEINHNFHTISKNQMGSVWLLALDMKDVGQREEKPPPKRRAFFLPSNIKTIKFTELDQCCCADVPCLSILKEYCESRFVLRRSLFKYVLQYHNLQHYSFEHVFSPFCYFIEQNTRFNFGWDPQLENRRVVFLRISHISRTNRAI